MALKNWLAGVFKRSAAPDSGVSQKEAVKTKSTWELIKPYYTKSPQKWKARAMLGTAVALTLGQRVL